MGGGAAGISEDPKCLREVGHIYHTITDTLSNPNTHLTPNPTLKSLIRRPLSQSYLDHLLPRALDVDHRCTPIWLKYTEMEMRHKQVRKDN